MLESGSWGHSVLHTPTRVELFIPQYKVYMQEIVDQKVEIKFYCNRKIRYSRTLMARTSLRPLKFVRDMVFLSH